MQRKERRWPVMIHSWPHRRRRFTPSNTRLWTCAPKESASSACLSPRGNRPTVIQRAVGFELEDDARTLMIMGRPPTPAELKRRRRANAPSPPTTP